MTPQLSKWPLYWVVTGFWDDTSFCRYNYQFLNWKNPCPSTVRNCNDRKGKIMKILN